MGDNGNPTSGLIHSALDGGVSGDHPVSSPLQFPVGPATANQHNRITMPLIPIACWRVDDIRFAFDSSFVLPEGKEEIDELARLIKRHTLTNARQVAQVPPLSIFGHADPIGNDDYNKALSGRRAAAIYGLLTRRTEIWEDLYSNHNTFTSAAAGDKWGLAALKTMGRMLTPAQEIKTDPGAAGRKKLFADYMDMLCGEFRVDPNGGFLSQGGDPAGKGDFQGCGEFNPLLIFSQEDNARFEQDKDKTERDLANASNRRVMVLLFRIGSLVDLAKWPCPRAKEGASGCHRRFWSDGDARRNTRLPDTPRRFTQKLDTFGCRFYQRMTTGSPCQDDVIRAIGFWDAPDVDPIPAEKVPWEASPGAGPATDFDSSARMASGKNFLADWSEDA
jgi:outer membrane protein OmpA-like peptidoglycan-associated protein